MLIFESILTEDHKPLKDWHTISRRDLDHLSDPEFYKGMDIENVLFNFHEFGTCYATYGIRLPLDFHSFDVKGVIVVPDVLNNNVYLVDAFYEAINNSHTVKLVFMGYCRNCKITIFVDAKEKEGE